MAIKCRNTHQLVAIEVGPYNVLISQKMLVNYYQNTILFYIFKIVLKSIL